VKKVIQKQPAPRPARGIAIVSSSRRQQPAPSPARGITIVSSIRRQQPAPSPRSRDRNTPAALKKNM